MYAFKTANITGILSVEGQPYFSPGHRGHLVSTVRCKWIAGAGAGELFCHTSQFFGFHSEIGFLANNQSVVFNILFKINFCSSTIPGLQVKISNFFYVKANCYNF